MSLIRRVIHGRRFCTWAPRRAEEIMSNPDCRASHIESRIWYLLGFRSNLDLDTAVKYARLAPFSRIQTEETELTCQSIIRAMLHYKRHKDMNKLYHYFFQQHELRPNHRCYNDMIESRLQQGLVDEALDFHRSRKARDYPSEDTFRILTKGLVQWGRMDQAEALLKEAKEIDSIDHPDHVVYNSLIRGYLDLGNIDKANRLLEEFKRLSKYLPDDGFIRSKYDNRVAFLVAAFMEYWFKQGKETEAMECYDRYVLAKKFPVYSGAGEALLKVLLKYGKKTHAWALYNDMLDRTQAWALHHEMFEPCCLKSFTVKVMVDECFDMGRCSEAVETYNKAIALNRFLGGTYMITRCCENGMLSVAESLVADLGGVGPGFMDHTIFKTMIDAYLKAGRIDDAIRTSNEMIDKTLDDVSHLF